MHREPKPGSGFIPAHLLRRARLCGPGRGRELLVAHRREVGGVRDDENMPGRQRLDALGYVIGADPFGIV